MVTLLVTFSRPFAQIINVPEVVRSIDLSTGRHDLLVDARQSAEIVEAWKLSQGKRATASLAGSTWRLSRSRSSQPQKWSASPSKAERGDFWRMSAFPWPVTYTAATTGERAVLGESEVLDSIAAHLNRYPDMAGASLRDFVANTLSETGRTIFQ